jgi:hypothetical protein
MAGHAVRRWKTCGVPSRTAVSTRTLLLLFPGVPVSVDSKGKNSAEPSYALELHVRGVIHVQVERLPPVMGTLLTSIVSAPPADRSFRTGPRLPSGYLDREHGSE